MAASSHSVTRDPPCGWSGFIVGFVLVFALFQVVATALGSERGEAGLLVAAAVVAALIAVELALYRRSPADL